MLAKNIIKLAVLPIIIATLIMSNAVFSQERLQYLPGEVLVKFRIGAVNFPETEKINIDDFLSPQLRNIAQNFGFVKGEKIFKSAQSGDTSRISRTGKLVKVKDLSHHFRLIFDKDIDVKALVDSLRKLPDILYAGPNRVFYPLDVFSDDPYFYDYHLQWGLYNFSNPGKDIHAPQAWDINQGNNNIKIAVVDGGVDYNHVDLDPGDRSRVISGTDTGNDDNDPMDDLSGNWGGHGTSVAGVIGAITNNDYQVAGVMWNCQIMPVKVAGSYDIGPWEWEGAYEHNIGDGINYATNNGADVISMSFGGDGPNWFELLIWGNPVMEATYNAFQQGVVLVAAMGNDDSNEINYPAGYKWTMAVGATDQLDRRISTSLGYSWGSNYGDHINVVAPGISHYSTRRYGQTPGSFSGTSCATPFVSGAAGLVLSESLDRELNLTNEDVQHILQISATKVSGMGGQEWHEEYGYGRINVYEALQLLQSPNGITRGISNGGSSQLVQDTHQHTFYNNSGLATGDYWVKTYKVTKSVTFPYQYLSVPHVWYRRNGTQGWSAENPNDEISWAKVVSGSVSTTGFNIYTYVYFVERNILGEWIGQWWPCQTNQVSYAYTALGELFTISGTLIHDETWYGTIDLAGNVFVPAGITLTLENGTIVNLNGYYLKSTGVSIIKQGTVTFNPDIRLMAGSSLKGQFPSTESACVNASSSDEIQLYSDETWDNDFTVTADVKVTSEKTLTIDAPRTISFNNNRKLSIYSDLDIDSEGGARVTFQAASGSGPGIWKGIWFYGYNNPIITNIEVKNATYGLKLNSNSYVDCRNSKFEDNTYGIYANGADADFQSVEFTNNSTAGITVYTTPFGMSLGTVTNPGADGIQTQSASPTIRSTEIIGNYVGVKSSGGTVDMGTGCNQMYGGFNSIYNNSSYELWVGYYTTVWALYNWWGQPSVPWGDIYTQGTVLAWCPLSSPPGGSSLTSSRGNDNKVLAEKCTNNNQDYNESQDSMERLFESIHYRQQNQYDQAADIQKQIILEDPHSEAAPAALWELAKTYIKAENKGYSDQLNSDLYFFLTTVSQIHAPGHKDAEDELYRVSLKLMVGDRMRNYDYKVAIERAKFLITEFPNSQLEEESLYDLFTIYWVFLNDETQAKAAFAELEKKYPKSQFIIHAKIELGIDDAKLLKDSNFSLASQNQEEIVPAEFQLFPNYPNPFNPTTTIQYSLPEASHVTLQIFNLRGELVRTLVNGTQVAKLYQIIWDSKNDQGQAVAAGIYICRFKAGDFTRVQRLVLLK